MILIKARDKKSRQLYAPGEAFYVAGVNLSQKGEIFSLQLFNNNTGTYQRRPVSEFDILHMGIL